ncbi:MAG: putative DNA binding domain-containing protein [Roseburia sp.]|nr:putative DNA binding domain-containing protein [Anaeroplasma bactoclasticum]MCM1196356.1 putative DNA binding domain-containing protein [Roseburia sp.]
MYQTLDLINLVDKLRLNNLTENEWLEFKSNYLSAENMAKDISALSNSAALFGRPFAYLIFGIEDSTHNVIGTSYNYRKEKKGNEELEPWLNRVIEPDINFKFYEFDYSDFKKVLLIEIPAAYKMPTRFSGENYIRIGSSTKNIKGYPERERDLWKTFNDFHFENLTSKIQTLNFSYLKNKLASVHKEFNQNSLNKLRLLTNEDKFNNLALLVSDENPYIVKFAYYKNSKLDFRVKKEFSGSWLKILDDVLDQVNLYNDVSARLLPGQVQRTEVLSYPEPSLREMIINAFMHLDIDAPSNIKIEFFPDRVDIGSPGSLYRTTLEAVLSGRQSLRNPNLVYLFSQLGYIENYATGFEKTNLAYAPYEQKPEYIPFDHFFLVKLPNVNYYLFDQEETNNSIHHNKNIMELTEQEQIIVDYIKQYGSIRRIVVEDILEIKNTRAKEIINSLLNKQIIKSIGSGPSIKYVLK